MTLRKCYLRKRKEKKMEEKNKSLFPILIVFICLTVLLGGYLIYDKLIKTEDKVEEKTENPIQETVKEETLPEWVSYILKQDLTAEYKYVSSLPNDDYECSKKDMTKDELKTILEKMAQGTLKKIDLGGTGSPCDDGIFISYGDKTVDIYSNELIDDDVTDPEVIKLLEKENYTKEDPVNPESNWVFEFKWDSSYIDTVLGTKSN